MKHELTSDGLLAYFCEEDGKEVISLLRKKDSNTPKEYFGVRLGIVKWENGDTTKQEKEEYSSLILACCIC